MVHLSRAQHGGEGGNVRELRVVDASNVSAVLEGLRAALAGDGPAILPHGGAPHGLPEGLPETIEQRVALVVETSGSTGRPKRVALSADALLASAAASTSALDASGQWLLALPTHYIAGANVLVRSLAADTTPVVMPEAVTDSSFSAEAFVAAAERLDHPTRLVSLVPAQLARLVASDAATDALRRFDAILVGGQSTTPELLAAALDMGLKVVRTYGSSETSGGCVYDGVPIGDTELAIVEGRVEITGSVLAEGYLGEPRRTAFSFPERDGRRWYRSDDTGSITDGRLTVSGRVDDIIVSGGIKVSLAEIEAVVRQLARLGDAVVVASPHPEWGEVPVVVSTGSMDLAILREAVAVKLGPAGSPNRLVIVDELPLLASGKPDRLAIATLVLQRAG